MAQNKKAKGTENFSDFEISDEEEKVDLPPFESERQSYFTIIAVLVAIIVAIFLILLIFDYLYGNPAATPTATTSTTQIKH